MIADTPPSTRDFSRFQFPVLGNYRTIDFTKPVQDVTDRLRELGSGMIEQPFAAQPVIFVADTALVAEVNDETHWEKHVGPSLDRLRSVLGDGLFTAYNHEPNWRRAHNLLVPLFTKAAMSRYHSDMVNTVRELIDGWNTKSRVRAWISVPADANRLTLEIISRVAMGHSFNNLSNPRERQKPFLAMLLRELAYADRHTVDISDQRKNQHVSDKTEMRRKVDRIVKDHSRDPATQGNGDIMHSLLHNKDPDTGEQLDHATVINELLTFLVVGSETSANAIAFALHLLSSNPDIAARARAEIDARWPEPGFPEIGFEDVHQLQYLRCIVDETLRLWPAAPGYFRQARHDTTIGNGKHHFGTGDWVFVHLIAAHRSDAWGPDAAEFNPDRFLTENLRRLPPRTYRPFGTGPRACIGRQFALHEILVTLAAVLHQFDLDPSPDYRLAAAEAMTLKPLNLQLRLHRRRV